MPFTYEEVVEKLKFPENLELELDSMNDGVDKHLNVIAMELIDWRAMAPALNLKNSKVKIINEMHPYSPDQRGYVRLYDKPSLVHISINAFFIAVLSCCVCGRGKHSMPPMQSFYKPV